MTAPVFPHLPAEGWELYLRDELSGSSLRSVEEHLDACSACREVLERRDPSRIFRRLRDLPVREAALDGLWDAVRAEISEPDAAAAPTPRRRERLGFLAGAATLLLSLILFQSGERPGPGGSAGLFRAEPCARLALSSEECRGLFAEARFDSEPPLLVQASADLEELL